MEPEESAPDDFLQRRGNDGSDQQDKRGEEGPSRQDVHKTLVSIPFLRFLTMSRTEPH